MDASPVWLAALLGLVVGSFLNVLVHRLPRMMEREWARDMSEWMAQQEGDAPEPGIATLFPPAVQVSAGSDAPDKPYDLARPRSHCPACGHTLRWHENIPVLSFVLLRGRCSACGAAIGWRYPLVELATAGIFAASAWRWGSGAEAWLWCGFGATLLALALIDLDTQLLPDALTQPLLWAGLIAAALGWNSQVSLQAALWGSVAGYLSLWAVYHGFKRVTGKEGMGQGDFKLLAALGAWLGPAALIPIVLAASLAGAGVGLFMRARGRLAAGQPLPFGPYLVAGAGLVLWFGPQTGWSSWP